MQYIERLLSVKRKEIQNLEIAYKQFITNSQQANGCILHLLLMIEFL